MPITDNYMRIPLTDIEVQRETRQRKAIDTRGLRDSIKQRGVVTPIIVDRSTSHPGKYILVAGERRLTASRELGLLDIPARLGENLSATERLILELEENIKRSDLEWKDFCNAIKQIHQLYLALDASWTQEKTADSISVEPGSLSIILRVAKGLEEGNLLIQEAPNYRAAYNILSRRDSRKMDDVFNTLMGGSDDELADTTTEKVPSGSETSVSSPGGFTPAPAARPRGESILCDDFLKWAPSYSGLLFSFIHCDFPYGIRLDKSDQGNTYSWGGYEDTQEVYWRLCKCLVENLDRLLAPSSHLMFWLSSDFTMIHKTITFFESQTNLTFNLKPLIWLKSDGKGILPDPNRGPRHVYETAIFASRGDRLIARSVADAYAYPKGSSDHQSEKPTEMLQHFFRMFVDTGTTMFDGTCGSGSSLCAAEALGAKVFGLEINPEWAKDANRRLTAARLTREGLVL